MAATLNGPALFSQEFSRWLYMEASLSELRPFWSALLIGVNLGQICRGIQYCGDHKFCFYWSVKCNFLPSLWTGWTDKICNLVVHLWQVWWAFGDHLCRRIPEYRVDWQGLKPILRFVVSSETNTWVQGGLRRFATSFSALAMSGSPLESVLCMSAWIYRAVSHPWSKCGSHWSTL